MEIHNVCKDCLKSNKFKNYLKNNRVGPGDVVIGTCKECREFTKKRFLDFSSQLDLHPFFQKCNGICKEILRL